MEGWGDWGWVCFGIGLVGDFKTVWFGRATYCTSGLGDEGAVC